MHAWLSTLRFGRLLLTKQRENDTAQTGLRLADPSRVRAGDRELTWWALPPEAQLYVVAVIVTGTLALLTSIPVAYPRPALFVCLLLLACLASTWKVNLPIPLGSSATLSVSYVANLVTLLLIGPEHAVIAGVAGVWTQCTFYAKRRYPWYRTIFSACAQALTMVAIGLVYQSLGGSWGSGGQFPALAIVGAIAAYFIVNTGLVATAIALSTNRQPWRVWRNDFLWSGLSFMIAGAAGASAAVIIERGQPWQAALIIVPVYLTYRTYQWFVGRLANEQTLTSGVLAALSDRVADAQKQYRETVEVLIETQLSERELALEKTRLARTVANMVHVQEIRDQALEREQAARATAEQANRLKDQFLATVSHELRTPLNAILGWADMLRGGALEEARRERACQAIYTSARHQAQLVNELLDIARIMSGKLPLEFAAVDIKDVVRGALEAAQPAADAKRIELMLDDDLSVGIVYGDATRLQQVVGNLLANAIKFTADGGAVHVRLRGIGDVAELVVTDTGRGIPSHFLPFVFDAFRQADGSTTRNYGGLGLGLSIVRHLVEAHHGTVRVESDGEGRGATFTVQVPVAAVQGLAVHAMAADDPALREMDERVALKGIIVLVVDDHDESRQLMAAHLEGRQAVVLTASSVVEALCVLQREHVDVLLADVAMPGEDGYTLIRKVRALRPAKVASIPAAAVTAFARSDDRQQALDAGFDLHLTKPIDAHTVVAAVIKLARPAQA